MHLVVAPHVVIAILIHHWLLLLCHLLLGRGLLLERRLLAEGWLGDLRWLCMELLVLRPHLLHLHLVILNNRLLLLVKLWCKLVFGLGHGGWLLGLLCEELLLNFFLNRRCACNRSDRLLGVLVFRPLLDLVVGASDELVAEVE